MSEIAQLVLPALRWDAARGYDAERPTIDLALQLGVGGFILFGGTQEEVRALTKELRSRSRTPLLISADMERGAGQQFGGATSLPPLAAIASLNDTDAVRRAGRLTAREARTIGVNWDCAPVCDLDVEPENPIVGTRAFGSNPVLVGNLAAEWIDACQSEGVLACAKHFPGHGRTTADSHAELPTVDAPRATLFESDLVPFRAAIEAGVASIMTAHVAYPALDPTGAPATLSREILQWFLRQQLKFDGLIVTDALIMAGAHGPAGELDSAVRAIAAGCDLLMYPSDMAATTRALEDALGRHVLDRERIHQSLRRRLKWAQWSSPPNEYRRPSVTDTTWGLQLAERCVHAVRGPISALSGPVDVVVVDDDLGGPYPPPPRDTFVDALRTGGLAVRRAEGAEVNAGGTVVVALFGDVRAWKRRAGYSADALAAVEAAGVAATTAGRPVVVVQFSHPRLAKEVVGSWPVVCGWGGDAVMQHAAARWLLRQA